MLGREFTNTAPRLPDALIALSEGSGSAVLNYGMTIVDGKPVNYFTVPEDSLLLYPVQQKSQPELVPPQQPQLVVRHRNEQGDWLAVSGVLSSKVTGLRAPDMEAIEKFIRAENLVKAQTRGQKVSRFFIKALENLGSNPLAIMAFVPGTTPPDKLLTKFDEK